MKFVKFFRLSSITGVMSHSFLFLLIMVKNISPEDNEEDEEDDVDDE